jgi:hypothetical protein
MSAALDLLRAEAARTSITAAAARCGIARSTASMLLSGTYGVGTKRAEAKILDALGRIQCPHRGQDITPAECREAADAPLRTGSPDAVKHWRVCRACSHAQTEEGHRDAR